jgi:hypothetical protein
VRGLISVFYAVFFFLCLSLYIELDIFCFAITFDLEEQLIRFLCQKKAENASKTMDAADSCSNWWRVLRQLSKLRLNTQLLRTLMLNYV